MSFEVPHGYEGQEPFHALAGDCGPAVAEVVEGIRNVQVAADSEIFLLWQALIKQRQAMDPATDEFGLPFDVLVTQEPHELLALCNVVGPDETRATIEVGDISHTERILLVGALALTRPKFARSDGPARVWRTRYGVLTVRRPWDGAEQERPKPLAVTPG